MRTCLVCAALVSLAVLRPAGQEQKPATAQDRASAQMTLTGCLRTSSTAEAARPVYTLEVEPASASSLPATGTAGSEATAQKKKISLSTTPSVDLEKHVGHQVRLTGELLQPPSGLPQRIDPSTQEAQPKPLPGDAEGTFRVTGVKMLSETCR
jgi:hypothetical protein